MHPMLAVAKKAVRRAGRILRRGFRRPHELEYKGSDYRAIVTDIDRNAELVMRETILKAYPNHAILGEEGGYVGSAQSDYLWILDPLDGTTNYVHGVPMFNTMLALREKGKLVLGIVYHPILRDLTIAVHGAGVWANRTRCTVSRTQSLRKMYGCMEWGLRPPSQNERGLLVQERLRHARVRVRNIGSSGLSSSYVAVGQADYLISVDSHPWDVAAGILFVEEAGGRVTNFAGESVESVWQNNPLATSTLLMTNGVAHEKLLQFVKGV